MPVSVDPLASLACWPVDVNVGGRLYTVPPEPATRWLTVLLDDFGTFDQVIELLSVADRAEIEQLTIDDLIDPKEMTKAFQEAVEVAGGRSWWMIINYLSLARAFWSRFHGRVLLSGLDPQRVSLGAYLDALHFAFIEDRDEQSIQKVMNFLETPPPGFEIELDQESESEVFLAMLNQ